MTVFLKSRYKNGNVRSEKKNTKRNSVLLMRLVFFFRNGRYFVSKIVLTYSLVTQPMLQPTPNQTELRWMVSKSFFNVDSKNVSEKFLHRHS